MPLDKMDRAILAALAHDARMTWQAVGRRVHLTGQAVATRVHPISFCPGPYDSDRFYELTRGMENVPEGGERCFVCYEMRLREAAEMAKQRKLDYFTTTLSISPLKNAEKLNEIGERLAAEYGIPYLNSDFKKRGGYQRSIELSHEYGLYRQDYCGCVFSRRERDARVAAQENGNS